MTRQTRTLILLAAVGLIAVVALGAIAKRYASLAERTVSVDDVVAEKGIQPFAEPSALDVASDSKLGEPEGTEPEATEPQTGATEGPGAATASTDPVHEEPETEPTPDLVPTAPARDSAVDPAVRSDLDTFIATREAFHAALEEHPKYVRQMKLEIDGRLGEQQQNPSYFTTSIKLTGERLLLLEQRGMSADRYREIRAMFRAYMEDQPVAAEWSAAFDAERATLEPLWFGKYEALDL
ncbi:MAG: hypothetical protein OER88_13550 [Planctomycetota bacterium]|nr:hypothetical protein [Planctomycetota bacterium]